MSGQGQIYVPIELFSNRKSGEASSLTLSTELDEEPAYAEINIFSKAPSVHASIKIDEERLWLLIQQLQDSYLELIRSKAYKRGAANAVRGKKK